MSLLRRLLGLFNVAKSPVAPDDSAPLAVGQRWRSHPSNPFSKPRTVKIQELRGDYLLYSWGFGLSNSLHKDDFMMVYRRLV